MSKEKIIKEFEESTEWGLRDTGYCSSIDEGYRAIFNRERRPVREYYKALSDYLISKITARDKGGKDIKGNEIEHLKAELDRLKSLCSKALKEMEGAKQIISKNYGKGVFRGTTFDKVLKALKDNNET